MEWADGSQPVRQTVGCGKWVAVSLFTYRDCQYFLWRLGGNRRFIFPILGIYIVSDGRINISGLPEEGLD